MKHTEDTLLNSLGLHAFTTARQIPMVAAVDVTSRGMLVTFYDVRYPNLGKYGQVISVYALDTLRSKKSGEGLCLYGGIDDWSIDAASYADVDTFLKAANY